MHYCPRNLELYVPCNILASKPLLKRATDGASNMPTATQLESLYRVGYQLTYFLLQPIHLCVDNRTRNVYILPGYNEELEFQILPNGELADESN